MSAHVSQIHPSNGSGENDCYEASLLRYLRDLRILDPGGDPWVQLDQVCLAVRGMPDEPYNPDTSLPECVRGLVHYGLAVDWTPEIAAAARSPYAICLVDGTKLQPAQYPARWFPGSNPFGNHFILWLPGGGDYLFDDPLAYFNGQQDCTYSPQSVAAAFVGAYLLPGPAIAAVPAGLVTPTQPARPAQRNTTVKQSCAGKSQPNHECAALVNIPAGAPITVLADRSGEWQRIVAGHYVCWVLASNVV